MKNTGKMTTIARPYVAAAFEYALANNEMAAWEKMLQVAAEMTQLPDVKAVLASPVVTRKQMADLFCEALKSSLDENKKNFIRLLAENNRLAVLPDISQLFKEACEAQDKTVSVQVTSAMPLDKVFQDKLTQALTKRLNRKVELECAIDPEVIGGAIIRAGDLVIDGSVRGKLNRLSDFI